MKNFITVVTPTYNRSSNLVDCYNSLLKQENKNFIWMIIDDGSTDDTKKIVKKWKTDNKICIEYYKKENGGKASSLNYSLDKCKTDLWMCLDSDDYLTDNSIEIIYSYYSSLLDNENICGLLSLRVSPDGVALGKKPIPKHISTANLYDIRFKLKIKSEVVLVFKTDIIKEYPYPIIENEKFMGLSFVYDQIDQKYEYQIVQEALMVGEYLPDGITYQKDKLIINNPKGYKLLKKQRVIIEENLLRKCKELVLYTCGCILDRDTSLSSFLKSSPSKVLSILLLPVSSLYYLWRFSEIANKVSR